MFKAERRRARANPDELPDDELSEAVDRDDDNDERFLRRLWRDVYGAEPVDGS